MRVQKYLSNNGYCSRRKAEEYILKGLVTVNDIVVDTLGFKVTNKDIVKVNGSIVKKIKQKKYLILNKPIYTISSLKDHKGRPLIIDYLPDIKTRVFPVGRLDFDTTGVILFTNDGDLNNKLLHPSFKITKKYLVTLNKQFDIKHKFLLENGVIIGTKKTAPAVLNIIRNSNKKTLLELEIYEGRKHQVKKMFKVLGYDVIQLHRKEFAGINDSNLSLGQYRYLSEQEIIHLKRITTKL